MTENLRELHRVNLEVSCPQHEKLLTEFWPGGVELGGRISFATPSAGVRSPPCSGLHLSMWVLTDDYQIITYTSFCLTRKDYTARIFSVKSVLQFFSVEQDLQLEFGANPCSHKS